MLPIVPEFIFAGVHAAVPDKELEHLPLGVRIYLPGILCQLGKLIPIAVLKSVLWLGHWKQSQINCDILLRSTWFLVGAILAIPTVGILNHIWTHITPETPQWYCVFVPQGGFFYITYMITSAVTGNMIEFLGKTSIFSVVFFQTFRMN